MSSYKTYYLSWAIELGFTFSSTVIYSVFATCIIFRFSLSSTRESRWELESLSWNRLNKTHPSSCWGTERARPLGVGPDTQFRALGFRVDNIKYNARNKLIKWGHRQYDKKRENMNAGLSFKFSFENVCRESLSEWNAFHCQGALKEAEVLWIFSFQHVVSRESLGTL